MFFTESHFTSITSRIHNRMLFLLWLSLFILSGAVSLLFSSNILGTYQPGELISQCHIFLPFHTLHGVLKARILKWFAIRFSSGPCFVRNLENSAVATGLVKVNFHFNPKERHLLDHRKSKRIPEKHLLLLRLH